MAREMPLDISCHVLELHGGPLGLGAGTEMRGGKLGLLSHPEMPFGLPSRAAPGSSGSGRPGGAEPAPHFFITGLVLGKWCGFSDLQLLDL